MIYVENNDYTIRDIEAGDGAMLYEAVNDNKDRLLTDFPYVVSKYDTRLKSLERASSLATASSSNQGFNVLVATDPENERVYGLGTRSELGKRALLFLPIKGSLDFPSYLFLGASLVAGWTTEEHPAHLAVDGLNTLLTPPTREGDIYGTNYANITLIRKDNVPALRTASAAGMNKARSIDVTREWHDITVNPLQLRLAGIYDGVMQNRELWIAQHPLHEIDKKLG